MELFENVDSVAHYNYQDSNGGPLNFVKIQGGVVGVQQNPEAWSPKVDLDHQL